MAGRIIQILSKTTMTMNFASGNSPVVFFGTRTYDVRDAVSGVLVVRVASVSSPWTPTGGSFSITLGNAIYAPDDPGTLYMDNSSGSTIASVTVLPTDVFPRAYLAGFNPSSTHVCGYQVAAGLNANYGSASGQASITLGVELVVRDSG